MPSIYMIMPDLDCLVEYALLFAATERRDGLS